MFFVNFVVRPSFARRDGQGDLHFGYVSVGMDWSLETDGGQTRADFSFDGNDECDHVTGRGWARIEPDASLYGRIAFHLGERSWFRAKRKLKDGRTGR